jgi:protein-tyrosine sulfotransferase
MYNDPHCVTNSNGSGGITLIDLAGNNLVFMLCVPRSGSSLATTLLQNHTKVFAAQEMWFLMSLYDLRMASARPYGGSIILDRFFNGMLTDEMFEQACRMFAVQTYNGLLQTSGSQIAVDKSPRYYYLLEFLDKLFPHSRRIWLIRNPLDVIASYKQANQHSHTRFHILDDLADPKFNINMTDITAGLFRYYHYFSSHHPHTYRLYYERLAAYPKEQLERLCGFLEIDYEEGLEKYGDHAQTPKGEMYTSMGVGDPSLFKYSEPHVQSINRWKEVLSKDEVERYCRVIGSQIFHDLGYSESLSEAEKMTGVRFGLEPDTDLLQLRAKQLKELTGCEWEERYPLKSNAGSSSEFVNENVHLIKNPDLVRLQITLQALEKRLEKSYVDQNRLRSELTHMREKIGRIKSMIPFGNQVSHWAAKHLLHDRRGK